MTTAALPITSDYSEGCFNRIANKTIEPGRKQILLIDDQGDTSLSITLQQEGFEVIACESPPTACGRVGTFRPHFIVIHLTNPSSGDLSTLQGCAVLAGGVPIIIAAPVRNSGTMIKALENCRRLFLFSTGPCGIGEILHDLDMSDRGIDSAVCHVASTATW
jgi:DNA-binding response OmpR family regulator